LDELILGGQIQETSKNVVLKAIAQQDVVQEVWIYWFLFCLVCDIGLERISQCRSESETTSG